MQAQKFKIDRVKTLNVEYEYPHFLKIFQGGKKILDINPTDGLDAPRQLHIEGQIIEVQLTAKGLSITRDGSPLIDADAETRWLQRTNAAFGISYFYIFGTLYSLFLSLFEPPNTPMLNTFVFTAILFGIGAALMIMSGYLMKNQKLAGLLIIVIFLAIDALLTLWGRQIPFFTVPVCLYFAYGIPSHKYLLPPSPTAQVNDDILDI
jgi:hypothetical protein